VATGINGYTLLGAASTSFNVTAISGGTMTTSASVTLPVGAVLTSSSIAFAGATVTAGGTGTSFTISNSSLSYSGSAVAALASLSALNVTSLTPTSISAASYNSGTGYVTFTTTTSNGLVPGSEFTVSGVTSSGRGSFNLTYVAVAGTNESNGNFTLVGNPLSGPIGLPQASALTGSSSYTSGGSEVSVLMPGMYVYGATGYSVISPFGAFGSTGVGGVGTYGLTATQATFTFNATISGNTMTVTGTPTTQLVPRHRGFDSLMSA
jgi:hypothetical protein